MLGYGKFNIGLTMLYTFVWLGYSDYIKVESCLQEVSLLIKRNLLLIGVTIGS